MNIADLHPVHLPPIVRHRFYLAYATLRDCQLDAQTSAAVAWGLARVTSDVFGESDVEVAAFGEARFAADVRNVVAVAAK